MCSFLVDESEAEIYLTKNNKEYIGSNDVELSNWFIAPYLEMELLINETINLEYHILNGNIKLETVGTARKDRYTSCSYGNFFASLLEIDLLKQNQDSDYDFVFSFS